MSGSKYLFIAFFLVLISHQGVAQSIVPGDSPEYQYPYSDEVGLTDYDERIEYGANSGDEESFKLESTACITGICPVGYEVDFCGNTYEIWYDSADGVYKGPTITVPSGTGPLGSDEAAKCSEGVHKVTFSDGQGDVEDKISLRPEKVFVSPSWGQERAEGKFLYLIGDTGNMNLKGFVLTDKHSKWDPIDAENTDKAYLYVEETDISGNEKALYELEPGVLPRNYNTAFEEMISASESDLDTGNEGNTWVATGSVSDGECSDDPCALVNWRQGEEVSMNLGFRKNNMSPVHSTNELYPDGEIAVGYRYYAKGDETESGEYISEHGEGKYADSMKVFLCKKPNHGLVISEKSDGTGPSYICDAKEKEWSQTYACSDGIDNDADGKIDHPDSKWKPGNVDAETIPECESLDDNTETEDINCQARVGRLNDSFTQKEGLEDNKVAFHDPNPDGKYRDESSGQNCKYDDYMADVPQSGEDKIEFKCYPDGSYDHPWDPEGPSLITAYEQKTLDEVNQICNQVSLYYPVSHGDYLSVSQVKYNETVLPYGPTFANSIGYSPFVYQTLAAAEESVFGSGDAHNYSAYLEKGISSSKAQAYQGSEDPDSFSDAWTIGNYMSPENSKIRGVNPVYNEDDVMVGYYLFDGGYAGNCPEEKPWGIYNGTLSCMPDSYEINLDYILPDVEEQSNSVGFKLISSTFSKFHLDTGSQIDGVMGACWRGLPEDKPDDIESSDDAESFDIQGIAEGSIEETLEKVSLSYNVKVEGVPTDDPGRYTCSWKVTDTEGNTYDSSDFDTYNWFNHRTGENSADSIASNVQENIDAQNWPEEIKDDLLPTFTELDEIRNVPDQVSANFFEQDGIS